MRYRKPALYNKRRTATSGVGSRPRVACMLRRTAGEGAHDSDVSDNGSSPKTAALTGTPSGKHEVTNATPGSSRHSREIAWQSIDPPAAPDIDCPRSRSEEPDDLGQNRVRGCCPRPGGYNAVRVTVGGNHGV